jgi:L-arabinose isomerase
MPDETVKTKVGLYGIGLDTYWAQFEGLWDRLNRYQKQIGERIEQAGATVIDAGLVDSPHRAQEAAAFFKKQDPDVLMLYISTYALSSTVLPLAQKLGLPVLLLNLQPVAAIDYESFNKLGDRGKMTGEWLAHCQACAVPEIAHVFNRAGISYDIITGYLDEPAVWEEISDWLQAAKVAAVMRNSRVGLLGHYYNGMLDVYSDLTGLSACFGTHFEMLEMCELQEIREAVNKLDIQKKLEEFYHSFDVDERCEAAELNRAAQTSVALDRLVDAHQLDTLAYYYEGSSGNAYENIVTSVIAGNTLLTGRHIPVAGECEVKNALAMKIMDAFDAGGSFSEFYAMDFNDDIVMLGHDGPAHFAIAHGRVQLVPLPVYHGKPGKGLSIQMTVKHGKVTLLSVVQGKDKIFLLVAEGESVAGPVLNIGNTNSRYRFPIAAREFVNAWSKKGPAHHCAIGTGHIANKIKKLAFLMNLEVVQIC